MSALTAYLPQDRLRSLAQNTPLPDRAQGTALFADISGFTPLTEALRTAFGARRGAETLSVYLEAVYAALITEVERYGGSVVNFAGDAITCWFDEHTTAPAALHATACALALQSTMRQFDIASSAAAPPAGASPAAASPAAASPAVSGISGISGISGVPGTLTLPQGTTLQLALKVAVATGAVRRFMVGLPHVQLLDVLAGATLTRLAAIEHLTHPGEVVVDDATLTALSTAVTVNTWRTDEATTRYAVLGALNTVPPPASTTAQAPPVAEAPPDPEQIRAWILPAIFEREQSALGAFLPELRPAVALFLRFTGIDYDHDDQAGTKLSTLVAQVQSTLMQAGGTLLDVTIGDKGSYLYLAFGAPTAHEDDVRRAVQTALDLRATLATLGFLAPVQIGISRGLMRTGAYGGQTRRTYGVLGDEVNVAARLMAQAAPGEILVTEAVRHEVAHQFSFGPRVAVQVKGKAEPLATFTVLAQHYQRAFRMEEPQYALPMIGRQAELALIDAKLALAMHAQGQVLGITAEAGMGKSRLVAEVIRLAHHRGFAGYGGACESVGTQTPYLVWKAIWRAFFEVDESAPAPTQRAQVERALQALAPTRVHALPVLGLLLDIPIEDTDFTRALEPKDRRNVLVATLEDCLRTASARMPHLIVLEDLHWLDALSHDLLEALARACALLPVCFVLAYRPPEHARLQAPRVETLPYFTRVVLTQLTPSETEALMHAKLAQLFPTRTGVLPLALAEQLRTRAEGNPFYIEELLNYLRDRALDPYAVNTLHALELPTSLHALILSRIDQLSESQKVTLKTASIIGRLFSLNWLLGYYPALGPFVAVRADLTELAKLDLTPLDLPEPDLTYLFKHIVTREVAYESMTYAIRADLHAQLAAFIESVDAERYLDLITFHYAQSTNRTKQRVYLQKAGDVAQAAFANESARDYFVQLLPLVDEPDARVGLYFKLADVHYELSDVPATRAALDAILHLTDAPAPRAAALARLGTLQGEVYGDYPSAHALLQEALMLARTSADPAVLARVTYALGDMHWRAGDLDAARTYLDESLARARALDDTTRMLFALNRLASVYLQFGLDQAEPFFKEAYAIASRVGNRERQMVILNNLGAIAYYRTAWADALTLYSQTLTLARELGARRSIAISLLNVASAGIMLRDTHAIHPALHDGLVQAQTLGAVPWLLGGVMYFADLLYADGHPLRALAIAGLVQRHPALSSDIRHQVELMLTRWNLDPATASAGLATGAALDFDATLAEILRELEQRA